MFCRLLIVLAVPLGLAVGGCASGESSAASFETSFDAIDEFEAAVRSAFAQENVRYDEDANAMLKGLGMSKAAGLGTYAGDATNGARVTANISRTGRSTAQVAVSVEDPDDPLLEQRLANLLQTNLGTNATNAIR